MNPQQQRLAEDAARLAGTMYVGLPGDDVSWYVDARDFTMQFAASEQVN
jgi:hypothetical protein